MPAARKTKSSSSSRASRFKEPAALKKLNKSLDSAQQALTELRKESGRGASDMYKDLRAFVSNARRDTGKLGKALAKDFEQAQKRIKASTTGSSRSTSSRGTSSRSSSSRSTSSRSTGSRAKAATTKAKSGTSATKRAGSSRSGGASRGRSSRSS